MTEEKKQVEESTTTQVPEDAAPVEENVEQETAKVEEPEVAEEKESEPEIEEPVQEEKKGIEETSTKLVEEEEVVRLEDLTEETEYSQEEISFLTQMYDKTLHEIKQGDIVKGKVLDVTDSDVLIDIGFKAVIISNTIFKNKIF